MYKCCVSYKRICVERSRTSHSARIMEGLSPIAEWLNQGGDNWVEEGLQPVPMFDGTEWCDLPPPPYGAVEGQGQTDDCVFDWLWDTQPDLAPQPDLQEVSCVRDWQAEADMMKHETSQ